jgi:hypothetical protein
MANAVYPKYKEALISGSANISLSSGTVKIALVDTAVYTYSAAHEFLTSLTGTVGTAPTLGSKTVTNGVFDAADPTWTAVTGATAEASPAPRGWSPTSTLASPTCRSPRTAATSSSPSTPLACSRCKSWRLQP